MIDVKSKFTLHTNYTAKSAQEWEIQTQLLSPHITDSKGCLRHIISMIFFLHVGVYLGAWLMINIVTDQRYVWEGQSSTGTVTSCQPKEKGKSRTHSDVVYTYSVGETVYTNYDEMRERCFAFPMGLSLNLLYLTSNPGSSRIIQEGLTTRERDHLRTTCFHFAMFIVFVSLIWSDIRKIKTYLRARWSQRRLAMNSTILEGEITAIGGHTPYRSDDYYYVWVRYTFETPRKKILSGYAEAHRQDLKGKELPPVGTPIAVLYADERSHMML